MIGSSSLLNIKSAQDLFGKEILDSGCTLQTSISIQNEEYISDYNILRYFV